MSVTADSFKRALRRWASGVTIVTAKSGDTIHGMTVSAFTSVSADPPLVLVCANRSSTTNELIRACGLFAVNVLADGQQSLSNRFASRDLDEHRFEGVGWRLGHGGAPVLEGALASLECKVRQAHEEGTHTIYIGEVLHADGDDEATPLVYFDGAYRRLA